MDADVEEIGSDTAVITVRGETDLWSGSAIDDVLVRLKDDGRRRIVVDASEAMWVNSKVLDALVRCAADLDPRHGEGLAVITTQSYVRQILEINATGGLLFLAESRDDALDALPRRAGA